MQSDPALMEQDNNANTFVHLLFGLQVYLREEMFIVPNSLRRALDALSFALGDKFPKTLYKFVDLCHHPLLSWYPLPVPDDFSPTEPILYDRSLSEEAQEFCLLLSERMQLSPDSYADIPEITLDNLKMVGLRERLKESLDILAAQQMYVDVRSFLIEHSWAAADELQGRSAAIFQALREFYELVPKLPLIEPVVCDRCGLLEWRDQRWQGVKPGFCSDHGSGSPYIHTLRKLPDIYRLKRGVHLRTFLPGRLELALFTFSDHAQAEHPDHLRSVERYPGLDTYDLRLTFSDDDTWAVDAKDHASPERLAPLIKPLYSEGDLRHTRAFYVIPDARMAEFDYQARLEYAVGSLPPNLQIISATSFQQRVEEKLKSLAKRLRRNKGKRV